MTDFLVKMDDLVWGLPLIFIIMGVGLYLTIGLKGLQIRRLPLALKYMVKNESDGVGEISSFAALCTALSATIGTGNIVGVATAIVAGGPGALFWMWIAALLGMCTKYAEGLLAIKYRTVDENGKALGGPFYYIEHGMGTNWKWLAKMFALFGALAGLLGIGTITQISGITSGFQELLDGKLVHSVNLFGTQYGWVTILTGLIVTLTVAIVLLGGIQRISQVAEILIPFMVVTYVGLCVLIIVLNFSSVLPAFQTIFASAFGLRAVSGGALGAMLVAMQKGVARGIFSNESGLGSAPIAAAAAKTNEPVRQGLVSMTGTFIDTIVVCTMTGLSIVITGTWNIGKVGSAVTISAFQKALPFSEGLSGALLMISLALFAYTTILGWNYYSEQCVAYLTNKNAKILLGFRYLYITVIFVGPYLTLAQVWTLADIFNGLMAFPNLIALAALSPVVFRETKLFFAKLDGNAFSETITVVSSESGNLEIEKKTLGEGIAEID
ncbi:MAG: sodium:alanine symporter family protein [Lactobacillales bacterium]|jgi:AGCS family alanine or glycine:cation symporter|nr:sodium:alanine symporter family protein [Lactobacillales bacterium]